MFCSHCTRSTHYSRACPRLQAKSVSIRCSLGLNLWRIARKAPLIDHESFLCESCCTNSISSFTLIPEEYSAPALIVTTKTWAPTQTKRIHRDTEDSWIIKRVCQSGVGSTFESSPHSVNQEKSKAPVLALRVCRGRTLSRWKSRNHPFYLHQWR